MISWWATRLSPFGFRPCSRPTRSHTTVSALAQHYRGTTQAVPHLNTNTPITALVRLCSSVYPMERQLTRVSAGVCGGWGGCRHWARSGAGACPRRGRCQRNSDTVLGRRSGGVRCDDGARPRHRLQSRRVVPQRLLPDWRDSGRPEHPWQLYRNDRELGALPRSDWGRRCHRGSRRGGGCPWSCGAAVRVPS